MKAHYYSLKDIGPGSPINLHNLFIPNVGEIRLVEPRVVFSINTTWEDYQKNIKTSLNKFQHYEYHGELEIPNYLIHEIFAWHKSKKFSEEEKDRLISKLSNLNGIVEEVYS